MNYAPIFAISHIIQPNIIRVGEVLGANIRRGFRQPCF
jgi:hypothetical protein